LSDIQVRNYRAEDDLEKVLRLYNSVESPCLVKDGHFFTHLIACPGVEPDGIFICEGDDETYGIVIVAVEEEDGLLRGNIVELYVKTGLAAEKLMQKVVDYGRNRNLDMVTSRMGIDKKISEYFNEWIKIDSGVVMVKPLCCASLLKALIAGGNIDRRSLLNKRLVIAFEKEAVEIDGTVQPISINPLTEILPNSEIVVRIRDGTFLEIVFGLTGPFLAYVRRRVQINRLGDVPDVLRFLASLKVGVPFINTLDLI